MSKRNKLLKSFGILSALIAFLIPFKKPETKESNFMKDCGLYDD